MVLVLTVRMVMVTVRMVMVTVRMVMVVTVMVGAEVGVDGTPFLPFSVPDLITGEETRRTVMRKLKPNWWRM